MTQARPRFIQFLSLIFIGTLGGALLLSGMARKPKPLEPSASELIWVAKSDGALSCEPDTGVSLEKAQAELEGAQIQVLQARKGSDGEVHIQMCGAPQGTLNTYQIRRLDLAAATRLGFSELTVPAPLQGQ